MTTNRLDQCSPAEAAELARDARALITKLDQGLGHAGTVFALTLAATIAAMKTGLHTLAAITALTALATLAATVLGILARIALGDPPQTPDKPAHTPATGPSNPGPVAVTPATSSAATTGKNRVILRK